MSASRPTSTPIRRISSGSLATSSRSQNQALTPLSFLQREALPMLDEETNTLQQNLAQIQEIHNALHTFDESFATFLYGIKMNAFCVEWPEAPSEQDLARPRPSTKKPTIATNPITRIDASADDSYRTDSDSSLPGPGSIRDLRATPKAQATKNGQRRVVNRREIPKRQQPQPKPAANHWKRQDATRNPAPKQTQPQTQLSDSDRKQAGKLRTQSTRRTEPQPVPKKIPLALKRRREVRKCELTLGICRSNHRHDAVRISQWGCESASTAPAYSSCTRFITRAGRKRYADIPKTNTNPVAELANPPELPAGKVNKALIALHAANHVVRTSQNVRDASNVFRDCCIG